MMPLPPVPPTAQAPAQAPSRPLALVAERRGGIVSVSLVGRGPVPREVSYELVVSGGSFTRHSGRSRVWDGSGAVSRVTAGPGAVKVTLKVSGPDVEEYEETILL